MGVVHLKAPRGTRTPISIRGVSYTKSHQVGVRYLKVLVKFKGIRHLKASVSVGYVFVTSEYRINIYGDSNDFSI